MGRVIYDTATTLNGWIADRRDSLDWLFAVDQDGLPAEGLIPKDATALVSGSTTYHWVVQHEEMLGQPEKWRQFFGDTPTFPDVAAASRVPDQRQRIGDRTCDEPDVGPGGHRQVSGRENVIGGGDLAGQFLDAGALDEIRLSVAPVALDGGAPLLTRNAGADRLRLVSASAYGQFARLVYSVS